MNEEKPRHKIRIETPEYATWGTRVFVDDLELQHVVNVTYEHCVGKAPVVTIALHPESIFVEGVAEVSRKQVLPVPKMDSEYLTYVQGREPLSTPVDLLEGAD